MTDTTIWVIAGQEYSDAAEVERLVAAGAVAEEITPEDQAQAQTPVLDDTAAQAQRDAEVRAFERTPEGKRQAAIREAAQHPGGIVTGCGRSPAFDELDAMSPEHTNLLKWT